MRRWLHCLIVALLCLTLFVDSARACWFLRQRGRRGSCPPPSCQSSCGPVVRHVAACPPVIHHGAECGCGVTVAHVHTHAEHVNGDIHDVIVHDHAVTHEGSVVAGDIVGEHLETVQGVVESGPTPAVVVERGTDNAPVVDRAQVNGTGNSTPSAASVVERPAQRSNAEQPLALPATQPATAIAPAPTAPQPAAAAPSLIQPAAGQVPAAVPALTDEAAATAAPKPVAPTPWPTAEPADEPAATKPASEATADEEPMEDDAPIGADDDDFPTPRRPARKPAPVEEPEMTEETEEPGADTEPAPATPARRPAPKPAVDNLFDDADDEPADVPAAKRVPADTADETTAPAADDETEEKMEETEPSTDEPAEGDSTAPAADGDEPEMVEEPAADGDTEAAPAADGDEPEMVEEADGEPAADEDAAEPADDAAPAKGESDAAALEPAEPLRRWADSTGAHETRGWLVGVTSTHVRILKVNGRHSTVAIDALSPTDQGYVADVAVKIAARRQAPTPVVKTAGL